MDALKRLRKEFSELQKADKSDRDIALRPEEDNFRKWQAFIKGPGDSPFEGGRSEHGCRRHP